MILKQPEINEVEREKIKLIGNKRVCTNTEVYKEGRGCGKKHLHSLFGFLHTHKMRKLILVEEQEQKASSMVELLSFVRQEKDILEFT